MRTALRVAGALALVSALAAGAMADPTPRPRPTATPQRYATNLCDRAAFYIWYERDPRPIRANQEPAHLGERFAIASGPRTTLDGERLYETTIPLESSASATQHYWVSGRCFSPD